MSANMLIAKAVKTPLSFILAMSFLYYILGWRYFYSYAVIKTWLTSDQCLRRLWCDGGVIPCSCTHCSRNEWCAEKVCECQVSSPSISLLMNLFETGEWKRYVTCRTAFAFKTLNGYSDGCPCDGHY
jgi:hypothetical protein